jgi:hypothetical protein
MWRVVCPSVRGYYICITATWLYIAQWRESWVWAVPSRVGVYDNQPNEKKKPTEKVMLL